MALSSLSGRLGFTLSRAYSLLLIFFISIANLPLTSFFNGVSGCSIRHLESLTYAYPFCSHGLGVIPLKISSAGTSNIQEKR